VTRYRIGAILRCLSGNDRFYEQVIPRAEALWERYLAERSTEREE